MIKKSSMFGCSRQKKKKKKRKKKKEEQREEGKRRSQRLKEGACAEEGGITQTFDPLEREKRKGVFFFRGFLGGGFFLGFWGGKKRRTGKVHG